MKSQTESIQKMEENPYACYEGPKEQQLHRYGQSSLARYSAFAKSKRPVIIRIVQQMTSPRKKGESYEITETKSSNCRVLSPAPIVFEWLSKQKEKQKYEKQVLGKSWNSGKYKDLVFTMPNGQHYTQSWVYKMFQRVLRAAELDHFRVHDLRHH